MDSGRRLTAILTNFASYKRDSTSLGTNRQRAIAIQYLLNPRRNRLHVWLALLNLHGRTSSDIATNQTDNGYGREVLRITSNVITSCCRIVS